MVTVNATQVAGTLTNFPVLVSVTDPDLQAKAKPDGSDIVFTDSTGATVLNYQIESYTAATGTLVAWVQAPTLSASANTVLYMYYGSSSAGPPAAPSTWDGTFKAVYHLAQDPGTQPAPQVLDSTSNHLNLTIVKPYSNGTQPQPLLTPGKLGNGVYFKSVTEYTGYGANSGVTNSGLGTSPLTMSAWVNFNQFNLYDGTPQTPFLGIQRLSPAWPPDDVTFWVTDAGQIWFGMGDSSGGWQYIKSTAAIALNQWVHLVGAFDGTTMSFYLNGQLVNTVVPSPAISRVDSPLSVAFLPRQGRLADVAFDEIRLESTARTAAWIQTEYANQNTPGSFYSVGSEQNSITATPTFSPSSGGPYSSVQAVQISTTTPNATICYTTDNSTPTETNCTPYTMPLFVSATTTIKAMAYAPGTADSQVATVVYTISPVINNVTVNPSVVVAGNPVTLTATLSAPAPAGGAAVTFTSTNPSAFAPPSMTIPAGMTSGSATVTAGTVSSQVNVAFSGRYGSQSSPASITVLPYPTVTQLLLTPSPVSGNGSSTVVATIGLNGIAPPGGAVVQLSSDTPSAFNPPPTITVPAGSTSVLSPAISVPVAATAKVINVTATLNGVSRRAVLQVLASGQTIPWYNSGWAHRKMITINATQVAGALTNFPVLVSVTDSNLQAEAKPDGSDIVFTDSTGTAVLNYEIESYTAASGTLVAWVQAPTLTASANTVLYMYYGSSSAGPQTPQSTWDSTFKAVYHMSQNPATQPAPQLLDSTSNHIDLTTWKPYTNGYTTQPSLTTGKAGNGVYFSSTGNEYGGYAAKSAAPSGLGTSPPVTISAWVNFNTFITYDGTQPSQQQSPFMGIERAAPMVPNWPPGDVTFWVTNGGTIGFTMGDTSGGWQTITSPAIAATQWTHVVGTFNGTTMSFYLNGQFVGALAPASPAISRQDSPLYLNWLPRQGREADIKFDEIRLEGTARSAAWIQTEYANQNAPSSFYSVSSEQSQPPIISSISPTGGSPVGASVTITGTGFGTLGSVTFNSITATTSPWSSTSITATIPPGATSGPVVVTSGGVSSQPYSYAITGISVSPPTQSVLAGGAMETASISVSSGTHWTASSAASWITFPYGNSGTGSGALQYQVAPNAPANGVQTGTILINSTAGTATLTVTEAALVNSPPTVTILNLTNGSLPSQAQQTVSIQVADPNGPAYVSSVQVVINSSLTNAYYSCQITYYPVVDDGVYLASGNAITAYALGVAGSAASPHCTLDTLNTTITYDQTSVTLNLALTLQPSAIGPQNIYVTATDAAAPTASVNANYASSLASWQGFAELTTSPPAVSMNPAPPPTSAANQVLHFKISDANGYTSMVGATGWLAAGSQTSNSPCYFQLSQPGHLTLYQMANSVLSPLGSGDIGASGVIGGSGACSIDLGQSKIYTSTASIRCRTRTRVRCLPISTWISGRHCPVPFC
jgi:hypothetical protein